MTAFSFTVISTLSPYHCDDNNKVKHNSHVLYTGSLLAIEAEDTKDSKPKDGHH